MREKGKGGRDVHDAKLDPLRERFRRTRADLGGQPREADVEKDMEVDRENASFSSSTGTPERNSGIRPEMVPVPESPSLSIQLPSPQVPSDGHQHLVSSFDKTCVPSRASWADGTQLAKMTWGQLYDQCSQRGLRKTRLATIDAAEAKRNLKEVAQEDGKRERAPVRGAQASDFPPWRSGYTLYGWDTRVGTRGGSGGLG